MVGLTPLRRQRILTSVFPVVERVGCAGAHKQKSSTEFTSRRAMHVLRGHGVRESKQERTIGHLTRASPTAIVRRLSSLDIVSCTLRRTWFGMAWTTRQNQGCRHARYEACEDVYASVRHRYTRRRWTVVPKRREENALNPVSASL